MISINDELEAIERAVAPGGTSRLHNKSTTSTVASSYSGSTNSSSNMYDHSANVIDRRTLMKEVVKSDSEKGDDLLVGFPGSDQYGDDEDEEYQRSSRSKKFTPGSTSSSVVSAPPTYKMGAGSASSVLSNVSSTCSQSRKRESFILQPESIAALGAFDSFDDSDDEDDIPPLPQSNKNFGLNKTGTASNVKPFRGERDSDAPKLQRIGSGQPAPHRPMVGGFAAAAYEAAREYHYKNEEKQAPRLDRFTRPPPSI